MWQGWKVTEKIWIENSNQLNFSFSNRRQFDCFLTDYDKTETL